MPNRSDSWIDQSYICDKQSCYIKYMNEQLMLYIKENERLINELRSFKHNVLNIMHGISGFIELEDWEELKNYFHDSLENIKTSVDITPSSMEQIKNPALKGLLSVKFKNAVSLGISFKVMADESIFVESDLIKEMDLCEVMNIFLDNAIEQASEAFTKKVTVYFLKDSNSTNIIVENTFKEGPGSLAEADLSSKEHRRLRLKWVNSILSNYPNILSSAFVQHQVYVQELQIIKSDNR